MVGNGALSSTYYIFQPLIICAHHKINEEQNLHKLTLWQFTRSTKCRSCPSFGAEKLMHFAFGHFL